MTRTPFCELVGIEHPVVQAPIGSAAVPALAAAVADAGALGMVALTWASDAGTLVRETASLTGHPFGGNLVLEWDQRARLDSALEAGLRVVSLTWGDPEPYVAPVHEAGGVVIHTVSSAEEARRAVAAGVDAVVAQGWESGGHVAGRIATLPLVVAVVDAVDPVPVVAAGGIGDGRGVAAVLALGAQAAWVGTRFLLAEQAPVHDTYREKLLAADETEAEWFAELFDGGWPAAPHRALRNSTAAAWEEAGRPASGSRPGEGETVAARSDDEPVRRYDSALPLAGFSGDVEALSLWAGQSVALARRVEPAAAIVRDLVSRL